MNDAGDESDEQIEEPVVYRYIDCSPDSPKLEDCPECRGKGTYALLISVRPCEACGGTGKIDAKALDVADDSESGAVRLIWVTTSTYDKNHELVDRVETSEPEDGNGESETRGGDWVYPWLNP